MPALPPLPIESDSGATNAKPGVNYDAEGNSLKRTKGEACLSPLFLSSISTLEELWDVVLRDRERPKWLFHTVGDMKEMGHGYIL